MPIAAEMTPAQLKEFNKYAKMEGVTYAVISNRKVLNELKQVKAQIKELEKKGELSPAEQEKYQKLNERLQELNKQKENRIIIIRAKDLEIVADITERMNQDIEFENVEQEKEAYENAGMDNLSPEDQKRYQDLQEKKESMEEKEFDSFNDKNNDKILTGTAEEPGWEEMNFEQALCRVTDRKYAKSSCFVCDRSDPDNYMEVSSIREKSPKGKSFISTEYKVFHQGVEQKSEEFSNGKFTHYTNRKGKNTSSYSQKHWENMKVEIKEKGGFSNDVLIFSNKEDYLKYKNSFEQTKDGMQLKEETISMEAEGRNYKDYAGIVNQLKSQLQNKGYTLNAQNEICRMETGTPAVIEEVADNEKFDFLEATNISEQIGLYEQLNILQTQRAFLQQQQKSNENNFESQGKTDSARAMYEQMKDELYKQEDSVNFNITLMESRAKNLQIEREKLSSVKIIVQIQSQHDDVSDVYAKQSKDDRDNDKSPHREEHTQSKESWNNQTKESPTQGLNIDAAAKVDIKIAEKE